MSSAQLYHRRSFFVGSPSFNGDNRATRPIMNEPLCDAPSWRDTIITSAFALVIIPSTLGVLTYFTSKFPLELYFRHKAPYSALTDAGHLELTMWGSLYTTISILVLWVLAEKTLKERWIVPVRWFFSAAVTVCPLPIGAAVSRARPAGFNFEHGLILGLSGLVSETVLICIYGVVLKCLGCLPQVF